MAQSSDLERRVCLVWKTDKPYLDKLQTSSAFSLLGFEWYLQLKYYSSGTYNYQPCYSYRLSLHQGTGKKNLTESLQFHVSTLIERRDNLPVLCECKRIETTEETLFDHPKSTLSSSLPSFENYGKMKIICLFYDFSSSTLLLHPKNETIQLSTQADMNSPLDTLRPEKGVQACMYIPPDLESLSLDLCYLLEKKVFPDVRLKCGDRTIPGHRSILAARSAVFNAMFRNKMVENETGVVDITDLDAPVLDLLLKYVYSGKIPNLSDDTACSLYGAADKYAIHDLKKDCSEWMIGNLSDENCIDFLTLADAHDDVVFKDAVVSFISRHQGVMQSESWLSFSKERANLAVEVYQCYVAFVSKKSSYHDE